ncbi:MAG: hypothetical protein ACE5F2_02335 [Candidatus Paceibacteria bacterium]
MAAVQNLFASSTDNAITTIASLSLDTIILAIIFIALFTYGLKYGKRRIISLIISLYISIPIISFFPYLQKVLFLGETVDKMLYMQIILFFLMVVLINILIDRVISWELGERGVRKLVELGALAIASGGLLVSISYHIIPITALHDFAPPIDSIFASGTVFFWWLVIPLAVLLFTVRR